MDAADPADPASDSLVMVVYNVQDDAYYDCAETTYTAGYFAPDFIDSVGHERHRDRRVRLGQPRRARTTPSGATTTRTNDRPTLYEGVIAHELEHLLHNYSDPGELSWVDEGLADFAVFLNGYDVGGSHLTYHQVFYADTSLTRWGGRPAELRRRVHLLPVPLGAGRRQRRRHLHARPAVRRRRRRPADQAHLREPGRRHGRSAGGDRRVQRADRCRTCVTSRRSTRTGRSRCTSTTRSSELWDIKAVDFGDPADHGVDDRHRRRPVLGRPRQQPGRAAGCEVGSSARTASRRSPCRTASRSSGSATPDRT